MLSENIKTLRKSKGLSQEQLGIKLNVVRQTISKWEQGLSVPDAKMLVSISEVFETSISTLLGESTKKSESIDLKAISEKLEVLNSQLLQRKIRQKKMLHYLFLLLSLAVVALFILLALMGSPYLNWNFNDPEIAVVGTLFHGFEWLFIRIAPVAFAGSLIGFILTRRKV